MSETPLFKRAFVRGLNTELMRHGVAVYPSKEAADLASDYIADKSGMPDPYQQPQQVTEKVASALCDSLIKASQHLCKEANNTYSPQLQKTAAASDPSTVAFEDAWALMEKAASETGSLMEGGDNPNDMPAAASSNAESALEKKRREENYANMGEEGVGNYERKGQGNVGTEEAHPEKPSATEDGSNSVTENTSKHGSSLSEIVSKISKTGASDTGSLMDPGQEENDMPAAASGSDGSPGNAEAKLEQNRRPENYASKGEDGVGRSDFIPSQEENVGRERPHPESPTATDSGKKNVPLEHTKSGAFEELFKEAAAEIVPYLPEKMQDNDKVAHVRAMLGLESNQRATYLHDLYTQLGAQKEAAESVRDHYFKTASQKTAECKVCGEDHKGKCPKENDKDMLPPALKAKAKGNEGDYDEKAKDEEKSDKKEASTNTLSSLQAALRNVNNA